MVEGREGDLTGAIALVTGVGLGIGHGIVEALARSGAIVAVNDVVEGRAEAVAATVNESGGRAAWFVGDISSPDDVSRLVRSVEDTFGQVDVLVNNAGAFCTKPFPENTVEDWDRVFAVNVRGCFLCISAVLPSMIERRRGNIINIASIAAFNTTGIHVAYGASKAAVVTMTRDIASEVSGFGIRVNAVAPGPIGQGAKLLLTEPHSGILLPYAGTPLDIGNAVAFLASDRAKFITGETLAVAGGSNLKVDISNKPAVLPASS